MSRRVTVIISLGLGLLLIVVLKHPSGIVPGQKHPTQKVSWANIQTTTIHDRQIKRVDTVKSIIQWRGTKLFGTGKHEGTVRFKEGRLEFDRGSLAGGDFKVDMTSIYITDIPLDQPTPRRNLTRHLNSDFDTEGHPAASLSFSNTETAGTGMWRVDGQMTIKGITHPVSFTAREIKEGKVYRAEFSFDRFNWNIGEDGSWLERRLVDAQVHLQVVIHVSEKEIFNER